MIFSKKRLLPTAGSRLVAHSSKLLFVAACCLQLVACTTIDLYEKVVPIPKSAWANSFKPSFRFTIKDTASPYQLFLILRHNEKYNYNNIWLNLYTRIPGSKSAAKAQYELPLATAERGWLGSGMDDLYEHRIALTPAAENFFFKQSGEYTFTVEQIMRDNPLPHVMNVGLRLEKKQP